MPRERTAGSHGDETAGLEPLGGRWLTIHEACAFLGVDQSTLRRWSDTGKVPVFRTPAATVAMPKPICGPSSVRGHDCRSGRESRVRR